MAEVRVSAALADHIAATYGPERTVHGSPSEWDFWGGPLRAALLAFRNFEALPFDDVPAIRRFDLVDPVFGPTMFVGVLTADGVVELAACATDPDYWSMIEDDPDD